jgi:hypothetical protein
LNTKKSVLEKWVLKHERRERIEFPKSVGRRNPFEFENGKSSKTG